MMIALVHDSLVEFGGAERVLQTLLTLFPKADLYSSYADFSLVKNFFPGFSLSRLHLSQVQGTPLVGRNSLFQVYSPLLWKQFSFERYNLVISNSSYMLCNLIKAKSPFHIQYINCPPKNLFGLNPLRPLQKILPYTRIIADIYKKTIQSSKNIIVNSKHTKKVIHDLFGVNSKVIYPPVKIPKVLPDKKEPKYFLCVGRIDRSKSIELAIEAVNYLKLPLKIVGKTNEAGYENYLRSIAGSTVEFLGMKSDTEIHKLYQKASAFLFTAKNEDFGIAPVEAMAHGVPVIAYYGGGLKETVIEKKTGLFFYRHDTESLINTLKKFTPAMFNPIKLYLHANKFNEDKFVGELKNYIYAL